METTQGGVYTSHRSVFIGACVLVALSAITRLMILDIHLHPAIKQAPQTFNFEVRVCDDAWEKELHHEDEETDHVVVTLHEGCFSGNLYLPKIWTAWWAQPTGDQNGDWIAYWLPGADPEGPYLPNQRYQFRVTPLQFRLQGHGKYVFYTNMKIPHTKSVDPSAVSSENAPERTYKKSEIKPTSGSDNDYDFIIEECHRSGEMIACSGKATNKTDARTKLNLHGGDSVDDEGNSVRVSTMFSGDDSFLMPNVPTNFTIRIGDNHQNVKSVNLDLRVNWEVNHGSRNEDLIYKDVPVQ